MTKNIILATILSAFAISSAMACGNNCAPSVSVSGTGAASGQVTNNVATFATVNGVGSSTSLAGSHGLATAGVGVTTSSAQGGNSGISSVGYTATGVSSTLSEGYASNVSTGNGFGGATSTGTAQANSHFNVQGSLSGIGNLTGAGATNSLSSYGVIAGQNTGGFAGAANGESIIASGKITATLLNCTVTNVFGSVEDMKLSNSEAVGGVMSGLAPAVTSATASGNAVFTGSFNVNDNR